MFTRSVRKKRYSKFQHCLFIHFIVLSYVAYFETDGMDPLRIKGHVALLEVISSRANEM